MLGFPIRTSSDPRSVDNSPRHIAASHVLHRLLVPRHPPCALTHLLHIKKHSTTQTHKPPKEGLTVVVARCSQPLSNSQTPHPATKRSDNTTPPITTRGTGVLPQDPTVCLAISSQPAHPAAGRCLLCTQPRSTTERGSSRLTPHLMRGVSRGAP